MQQQIVNSILAADVGAVHTRVILIDLVDGQYRLVSHARARTTMSPPLDDVWNGLLWATQNIELFTQRQLTYERGLVVPEQDGIGFDEFVVTSSAGRPLNTVVLGLMPELSINSARRALTGTYINIAAVISIADQQDQETQINTILRAKPDLIFITGGTDGGNREGVLELVRLADLAAKLFPETEKPMLLYAGNHDLTDEVEQLLSATHAEINVAPNIRPHLFQEELGTVRLQLAKAYSNHIKRLPGGFRTVIETGGVDIIPTAQGITNIVRWLGESQNVLHLDIGSATSTLITSLQGTVNTRIHSEFGVGHSILSTLERLDLDRILAWLPFEMTEDALWNYAHNKLLIPDSIPQTQRDLLIEQAITREIIRTLITEVRANASKATLASLATVSPIILAGATLTEAPHPGIAAMMVLDTFELEGMSELYADPYGLMPALGSIAYTNPIAAVQVFENHGLVYLGAAFCASGTPRQGRRPAMRIKIMLENERVIEKNLPPNELWTAPIAPGQKAYVDIRIGRGLKINGKRRIRQEVETGTAGIIFDTRGRPLSFVSTKKRGEMFAALWSGVTNGQLIYTAPEAESSEQGDNYRARQNEIRDVQRTIAVANLRAARGEREEQSSKKGRRRRKAEPQPELELEARTSFKKTTRRPKDEEELAEPDWDDVLNL